MATVTPTPVWQRTLVVLTGTIVGVVVVGCFYWAQTVFHPASVGGVLELPLSPPVNFVQKRGVWRTPAVILVVLLAALFLIGAVWLVTVEIRSVAGDLPQYTQNIKGKVKSLQEMAEGTAGLGKMIKDITGQWNLEAMRPNESETDKRAFTAGATPEKTSTVIIQPQSSAWLSRLPATSSVPRVDGSR